MVKRKRGPKPLAELRASHTTQVINGNTSITSTKGIQIKKCRLSENIFDSRVEYNIGDDLELKDGCYLRVREKSRLRKKSFSRKQCHVREQPDASEESCAYHESCTYEESSEGNIIQYHGSLMIPLSKLLEDMQDERWGQLFDNNLDELLWQVEEILESSTGETLVHEMCTRSEKDVRARVTVKMQRQVPTATEVNNIPEHPECEDGLLICRWKICAAFVGRSTWRRRVIRSIEAVDEGDNEHQTRESRRKSWLCRPEAQGRLEREDASYTFGDAFCGAGGVSRGAVQAGLDLKWGFDDDYNTVDAYRRNFNRKGTSCIVTDASNFARSCTDKEYVDILHASPPCQAFSAVNINRLVERDVSGLQPVSDLLKKTRPRLLSIENVPGLFDKHSLPLFIGMIKSIMSLGFSVRWQIINCWEYGVPQKRRRVYVLAACPGETLPQFPTGTHGPSPMSNQTPAPGREPCKWVGDALRIPDAKFLSTTVMCNKVGGRGNGEHPSKKRRYTTRELAKLQSFPQSHKFDRDYWTAHRQIGNAVPPLVAKVIFLAMQESLRKTDEESKHASELHTRLTRYISRHISRHQDL